MVLCNIQGLWSRESEFRNSPFIAIFLLMLNTFNSLLFRLSLSLHSAEVRCNASRLRATPLLQKSEWAAVESRLPWTFSLHCDYRQNSCGSWNETEFLFKPGADSRLREGWAKTQGPASQGSASQDIQKSLKLFQKKTAQKMFHPILSQSTLIPLKYISVLKENNFCKITCKLSSFVYRSWLVAKA